MAGIVDGLFGLSPAQTGAQEYEMMRRQAAQEAQLSNLERAGYGMRTAGASIGRMGMGMLGLESPAVREAKMREQALTELDPSDPKSILERAAQIQDPRMKMQLTMLGRQMLAEQQKAKLVELKTRHELLLAERSGQSDMFKMANEMAVTSGLQPGSPDYNEFVSNFMWEQSQAKLKGDNKQPTSVQEYEYAKANGYKGSYDSWLRDKASAGRAPDSPFYQFLPTADGYLAGNARTGAASPLIVNGKTVLPAAQDPALQGRKSEAEATGSARGKATGEEQAMLPKQREALIATKSALDLLDDGIYTGMYGPAQKAVVAGSPFVDKKKVENTDTFIATIGQSVIPRLKEFGGNDSNQELQFLQKVQGGDISMQEGAIRKVLKEAEAKIQRGIKRVSQGMDANGKPIAPSSGGGRRIKFDAQGNMVTQ